MSHPATIAHLDLRRSSNRIYGTTRNKIFLQYVTLIALATFLSCSQRSVPVAQTALLGTWQSTDQFGIRSEFLKDGTLNIHVIGLPPIGVAKYQLIDGDRIVISSEKAGRITNRLSIVGEELTITTPTGKTERYKRIKTNP